MSMCMCAILAIRDQYSKLNVNKTDSKKKKINIYTRKSSVIIIHGIHQGT